MASAILACMIRAKILYAVLRSDMGLYISGSQWEPLPLKISTTVAVAQASGGVPVYRTFVKSCANRSSCSSVSILYSSNGMLSGPAALLFLLSVGCAGSLAL